MISLMGVTTFFLQWEGAKLATWGVTSGDFSKTFGLLHFKFKIPLWPLANLPVKWTIPHYRMHLSTTTASCPPDRSPRRCPGTAPASGGEKYHIVPFTREIPYRCLSNVRNISDKLSNPPINFIAKPSFVFFSPPFYYDDKDRFFCCHPKNNIAKTQVIFIPK